MCEAKPGLRCSEDTSAACADTQCAYLQAHPDGPPVNPVASAEASFDAYHHDEDAVAIEELDLSVGDTLSLSDYELGTSKPFSRVQVTRTADGYEAQGHIPVDFTTVVPLTVPDREVNNYLSDRTADINEFLSSRYPGAKLAATAGGEDAWDEAPVAFTTSLTPTSDTTADLVDRCSSEAAEKLHGDVNNTGLTDDLRAFLAERDAR